MHTDINFQMLQAIHHLSLVWFWLFLPFVVFLGPSLLEPSILLLQSGCGIIHRPHERHPFPILHPSSMVGCLFTESIVFLCFVLHHHFTRQHPPEIQRKRIWEGKCFSVCKSEKVFYLHIWSVVWLYVNTYRMKISLRVSQVLLQSHLLWNLISPIFLLCLLFYLLGDFINIIFNLLYWFFKLFCHVFNFQDFLHFIWFFFFYACILFYSCLWI